MNVNKGAFNHHIYFKSVMFLLSESIKFIIFNISADKKHGKCLHSSVLKKLDFKRLLKAVSYSHISSGNVSRDFFEGSPFCFLNGGPSS
jgi:hypothetical protein